MFAERLKSTLEREIVGQPHAINGVVRGVTRVASGLTPRERPLCIYLLLGPPGTGKTHLVRTIARVLHGDDTRLNIADCQWTVHGDPWISFVTQLTPAFLPRSGGDAPETPPLSVILVEGLEAGPREFCQSLASALKTAQVQLPEGKRGLLRNCLVFLTTSLCTPEILEESPRIGFTGSFDEDDEDEKEGSDRVKKLCIEEAEKQFGSELLGQLDGIIIFRRLEEQSIAAILDQRFARLNERLLSQGFQAEMRPAAREFLLRKGTRRMRLGARDLVLAHRKHVEFPIADLLISGGFPPGGVLIVNREPGEVHLSFVVRSAGAPGVQPPGAASPTTRLPVDVTWVL